MASTTSSKEEILEPDLPIIDPHHHLWDRTPLRTTVQRPAHPFYEAIADVQRYLLEELLADTGSGHNVRATVFLECRAMYRADGPESLKCVGETEFVNGVAAMSASGIYGETRACAGIVGNADLRLGDAVEDVLRAHMHAARGRFRGIRNSESYDKDPDVLGPLAGRNSDLYRDEKFREGFAHLHKLGLSFDAWLLEPQLPDLVDLAQNFPETTIVLDHVGTPLGIASYQGRREERFPVWRKNIESLSKNKNVFVKLGGLAMAFCNFPSFRSNPPAHSEQLAREWRPYIDSCIQAFGPDRCMFESNFPVDIGSCSYPVLWNAFKRIAEPYSAAEKSALFSDTAARVYRLKL
ncbi:MAG: amidohydrolase family protein [Alphaproteobacteria bacterium]|nr:amidohydrolase family protein [Alphaproteobacteria bacterium]